MTVALRRNRDNSWRKFWYGEYRDENGVRRVVNVGEWEGTPPANDRTDGGDKDFERSRQRAEVRLDQLAEEARRKGRADHLIERLIESKTGKAVEYVRLDEMLGKWMAGGEYSTGYVGQCKAVFGRFLDFMKERNPAAVHAYQVRPADTTAFMAEVRGDMSRATTKAYIGILRPAFDLCLPAGAVNPFRAVKGGKKQTAVDAREGKGFHRVPFTPAELAAVLAAAADEPLMHALITACACTGMRRGDVCGLRWRDVDLKGGVVVAKASKTGETVEVPIFEPLRAVLEARLGNGEYVFPEAAAMLRDNPDGLTWRFKKIVARALGGSETPLLTETAPLDGETEADGTAAIIRSLPAGERRERIIDTFRRYCGGATMPEIIRATGRARGTVGTDLATAQRLIGKRIIRARKTGNVKDAIATVTRAHRERGQRSASVRDWHALRTTFVTLALSAGVPVELVKRVTGHQTTAIVMEHYFRPDREQFRAALTGALPEVLTGRSQTADRRLQTADQGDGETADGRLQTAGGGDLVALCGKVAAGTATKAETARFKKLAAGM